MRAILLAGLLAAAPAALAAPAPAPPDARAHKEIGDQRRKAGDAEGALEAYRTALQRFGGYAEASEAMGEVHFGLKHYAQAIEAFGLAVELDPAYALAWYNLGFAARKAGDLPRARTAYERYLKLRAADPDGHFGYAETLRGLGEREAAAREYQLFIDLAKDSPAQAAWVEKARAALADLRPAPAPPPGPTAGSLLAGTGALTGVAVAAAPPASPTGTAAADGTAAPSAAAPASAPSQALIEKLGAGDRAYLAGDHRAALFHYQDAVYLDPGSSAARIRMAKAYAGLRYPDKAEVQLQQVLSQEPGNAEARKLLEELFNAPARPGTAGPAAAPPAAGPPAAAPAGGRVYKFTPEAGPAPAAAPPAVRAPREDPLPPAPPPPAVPPPDTGPAGPSAADLYRAGVAQVGRRDFALAVDSFNRALERDPGLVVAYEARASARFGLQQYREAAQDYLVALNANPTRASPLWGMAECYRLLGDGRAAETYARYAESTAPDVVESQRDLARKRANELRGR